MLMKKIVLIFLAAVLIFLVACQPQQPAPVNNANEIQCVQVGAQCCKGEICASSNVLCVEGTGPVNKGCDENCVPVIECVASTSENNLQEQTNSEVKEFTIEGDDLGLYPETITVNKNDKVKITFKVRNENVYYGGLDFRSEFFDTGKVLPGSIKTVEFTAQETFSYKSYWPSSNKLKATGTINVN